MGGAFGAVRQPGSRRDASMLCNQHRHPPTLRAVFCKPHEGLKLEASILITIETTHFSGFCDDRDSGKFRISSSLSRSSRKGFLHDSCWNALQSTAYFPCTRRKKLTAGTKIRMRLSIRTLPVAARRHTKSVDHLQASFADLDEAQVETICTRCISEIHPSNSLTRF